MKNRLTSPHYFEAFEKLQYKYGAQACQCFTTFAMKSLMFQHFVSHHDTCISNLGRCVLELIGQMRKLLFTTQPNYVKRLEGVS